MLRVIEPADPAPWASISEEMRQRKRNRDAAESLAQRFAAEAWAECGVTDRADHARRRGEARKSASSWTRIPLDQAGSAGRRIAGPGGPGPLVSANSPKAAGLGNAAGAGSGGAGRALTRDEIRAVALLDGRLQFQ